MGIYRTLGLSVAAICFRLFARVHTTGIESVPPNGPLIIICNHMSYADAPILSHVLNRRLHFMAKRSLFNNWLSYLFLTGVDVHPVDSSLLGLQSIRTHLDLLGQDKAIAMFPEGTRSRTGAMNLGKPGVAYIATKSQAPILPIAITGTEHIRGFWRIAFPFSRITVTIGQPFSLPIIEGSLTKKVLINLTEMIMERIATMLPKNYRGYYDYIDRPIKGTSGG